MFERIKNAIKSRILFFIAYLKVFIKEARENPYMAFATVFVLASSTSESVSDIILEWMPLIVVFAMLGMILGLMKKLGKF